MKYAIYNFSPENTVEWFEEHGLPVKTEITNKIYPVSDNANDVINVFKKMIKNSNTRIVLNCEPLEISKEKNLFKIKSKNFSAEFFDKIILSTGSSLQGYNYARIFGHTITDLAPGLTSLLLSKEKIQNFQGISFKNIGISISASKNYFFKGDMIFTHKGISGPGIFAIASMSAYENFEKIPSKIKFDLVAEKNEELIFNEISKKREKNTTSIINFLTQYSPKKIINDILLRCSIDPAKRFCEASNSEIRKIINTLKNFDFEITGRDKGDEFVRAGGVNTDEVDFKTMQSKICPGLYITGELLNVDGFTGGFNLQAAWSTGRLAGISASTL